MQQWLATLIGAAIGVLIGIPLSHWLTRRYQESSRALARKGHLSALAAEVDYAASVCKGFLDSPAFVPLYRLPVLAYENSMPSLFSEGVLSQSDVTTLLDFYGNIDSFNRGLDFVQQHFDKRDVSAVVSEVSRLSVKARKAIPRGTTDPSFYDLVAIVLASKRDIKYRPLPVTPLKDSGRPGESVVEVSVRRWEYDRRFSDDDDDN